MSRASRSGPTLPIVYGLLALFTVSSAQAATPWAGVLSSSRAIDWSNAGLPATLPDGETTSNHWTPPTRTQCGATLTPSGGNDTTQITNAVAACGEGTYVLLGSGSFTISSNLILGGSYTSGHNYVTVRGSGPMSTKLVVSAGVRIQLGASSGQTGTTLASSPAQGATSVTLSNSGNVPSVGQVVWLQQCDNGQSGNPCNTGGNQTDTGGLYWCGQNSVCMTDSPGQTYNNNYLEFQAVRVTSVSGATIGFTPGLYQPDWSTTRSASLEWLSASYAAFGMGLEDLTVQYASGANGVSVNTCYACWLKGLRLVNTPSNESIALGNGGAHNLVANNYIADNILHDEIFVYSFDSDDLIVNNITDTGFWEGGGSSNGEVFAYNYVNDSEFQHEAGSSFNLFEGNQIIRLADDDTWGTHNLNTFFRNYDSCWIEPYNYQPNNDSALLIDSYARFENVVGNALGSLNSGSPHCMNDGTPGSDNLPFDLGVNAAGLDPIAAASVLNWGNYAVCIGASCNTVNFLSSGNPTTLTGNAATYNNLSSPSTTLPASFFMNGSTAPSWWAVCTNWTSFPTSCATTQTQPYPLNGPGIHGGLTENPYANNAPAAVARQTLPIDSTYQVSYAIVSSGWSGGVETLNISGSFPTIPTGGFQLSGAPSACLPSSGASYTGRLDGELLITYPSTTNSLTYALPSNPGGSCTGTIKWPDVRQFDERVYGSSGSSGATPPTISAFTAMPLSIASGQSSTLSWTVANATTVVIDNSIGDVTVLQLTNVSPNTTTTYALTAWGLGGGPVTQTVTVTVTAPQILWSGILDPTRAVDWSIAGAGTIPNRTTLCQTLNPGATATQINSAIAGCSNGVVLLSAGTYNLTSPISILHSNVTLRGAGADQTFLKFTGNMQSACDNAGGDICIYNGNGWYAGGPGMTANWTGSSGVSGAYSQGATQITLDNTTGLQVGSQLILDQLGDNADTGNIYQGQNNTSQTASTCDACNNPGRPGRPQTQTVQVQNISGSGPYTVTITPPLYMPNWRSSQSPGAWWGNGNLPITESGIENLSVDSSGVQNGGGIITLAGTTKCWVKGVRTLFEADSHIKLWYGNLFNTIRDNYMYGSQCHGGTCSQSYGINTYTGSANLFENNICDSVATCFQLEDHQGSVYGYNYAINEINPPNPGWMLGHLSAHAPGNMYLLWEGNQVTSSILDDFHGPADFITEFRNRISGWQPGIPTYYQQIPLINQAWSRYTQAIGNVFGTAGIQTRYTSIEGDGSDGDESCQHSIYAMGWGGNCGNSLQPPADGQGCSPSNTCPWPDPLVATTFLRWGNWDTFNGSPQWNPSEVPSGLSIYANPVPASQTLPSSFYLSGKPAWWPSTIHFPPIGPDVSGGDIPNLSGHAYNIPAEACWKNTIFDPAYVTTTPNVTATWSAGIATVNMSAVPAAILPAAAFTVTGMNPSGYNCNNCVILSNSATTISYAVTNDPGGSGSGGTIYLANDPIGSGSLALAFNADTCYGTSGSSSLSIKTTSLPNGTTSATYGQTLSATGGTPPYSWSIVSGTLPAGLALTGISGALSGTPTTAGTFNFTVQVQDIASPTPATATQLFSITISSISSGSQPLPLTLPIPDLSGIDGKIFSLTDQISFSYPVSGVTFQWQFNAINGNPSIEMTGAPAGAPYRSNGSASIPTSAPRFTPASANLTPGTYTLTVTVTQGNQSQSATATITLAPSDLSSVKVYPNPWRSDKHAGKSVTFANLPIGSTVKLFTVSGHLVKTVIPNLDTATWDLTNDSGDKVASGIYLYVITDGQGNKTKGKVAVIK